jgi:muramoyltetrapeptide carboxypeptidase
MTYHIRIIAPSGTTLDPQKKLAEMISFLKSHNFTVSVLDNIFADPPLPFYSNVREIRLEQLKDTLLDPTIDIIWTFRGGTGAPEIAIPAMDIIPNGKKIMIGFSDITALHLLFNQHYKVPSIHGPVLTSLLDKHPEMIEKIKEILAGKKQSIKLTPQNDAAKKDISGELIGGNLTMLATMIGTKLEPQMEGKILVLEEVNDPGYKIRRVFTQLEQSGKIANLAACILGDFTGGDKDVEWAINDFIERNPNLPIYRTSGIGHGDVNIPLVFGKKATIIGGVLEYDLRCDAD